jgi:hypothetical protein
MAREPERVERGGSGSGSSGGGDSRCARFASALIPTNRVDFPEQDPALQVNLVWAADGNIAGEPIPQPSPAVAALAGGPDLDVAGRLLE